MENRKKRMINIIFYLLMIIVIGVVININKDIKSIINRKVIVNSDTYEKYKDLKFVTFDVKDTSKTRFSLEEENNENLNVYIVKIGNKNILLELTSSSLPDSKINLMKMDDDSESIDLKNSYNSESEKNVRFEKGYYTNKNLTNNEDLINKKIIGGVVIIGLCLLCMLFNLVFMFRKNN